MSWKRYTELQLIFLRRGYRNLTIRELTRAFNDLFEEDRTEQMIKATLKRHGFGSGRTGNFEKGIRPWNKGTKGQGLTSANSGSFKKGSAPPNRRSLGSERICLKDGYILVKVAETNPHTGFPTRFKHKHAHIWEQANGPVPDGMVVFFVDGDKTHCDLGNLKLISRAELLIANQLGYSDAPADLKPSILALARLKAKAFSKGRNKHGASRSEAKNAQI